MDHQLYTCRLSSFLFLDDVFPRAYSLCKLEFWEQQIIFIPDLGSEPEFSNGQPLNSFMTIFYFHLLQLPYFYLISGQTDILVSFHCIYF